MAWDTLMPWPGSALLIPVGSVRLRTVVICPAPWMAPLWGGRLTGTMPEGRINGGRSIEKL